MHSSLRSFQSQNRPLEFGPWSSCGRLRHSELPTHQRGSRRTQQSPNQSLHSQGRRRDLPSTAGPQQDHPRLYANSFPCQCSFALDGPTPCESDTVALWHSERDLSRPRVDSSRISACAGSLPQAEPPVRGVVASGEYLRVSTIANGADDESTQGSDEDEGPGLPGRGPGGQEPDSR